MRIATSILGLVLGAGFLVQALTAYAVGGVFDVEDASTFGLAGLGAAFLWLLGSAFVFALPEASIALFALAGILSIAVGRGDLIVWGVVAFALAGLSVFGAREKEQADADRQLLRDAAHAVIELNLASRKAAKQAEAAAKGGEPTEVGAKLQADQGRVADAWAASRGS